MISFLYLIEPCIINNYNLVNTLHEHNILFYNSNYTLFKQFIVFNNILFNLNLIRIFCYRTLVRYDLSAFYIKYYFLMFYIIYLYFLCIPLSISM